MEVRFRKGAEEREDGKIRRRDQDEYILCSPARSQLFRGSSSPRYQIFLGYHIETRAESRKSIQSSICMGKRDPAGASGGSLWDPSAHADCLL